MKKFKKTIALVLTASMLVPAVMLTGCNKGGKSKGTVIDEDAPWFNVTSTAIGTQYAERDDLDYYYCGIRGIYNDGVVVLTDASLPIPEDFDWDHDDYSQYQVNALEYYSLDGELISSINYNDILDMESCYIDNVNVTEDGVEITITDYSSWDVVNYKATVDFENGTISEPVEVETDNSANLSNDNMWSEGTWTIGDYVIERYWMSGDNNNSYTFAITGPEGTEVVDLSREFPNYNIYDISQYIQLDDETLLLVTSSEDVDMLKMNIADATVEDIADGEFDWMEDVDMYNLMSIPGSGTYSVNNSGVTKVDMDNQVVDEVLSFSDSNVNRYILNNLQLLDCSDDQFIFAGSTWKSNSIDFGFSSNDTPVIVVMDRAETNPNAGKTLITATTVGDTYMGYPLCEAICRFNDSSEDYFISIDNRYNMEDYVNFDNAETSEDYMNAYYSGTSELSNQLAIDMMAGDAPDIILNASNFGQILSDDYLLDLTDYMNGSNGIDEADYFSNIIDSAKIDDKLFYMPLSFSLIGISTDKSNVENGQTGFTFDEYVDFVDEVCNGSNPISASKIDTMTTLYSNMSDLFVDGNNVNFDNEAFRALAEYINDNVNYIEPTYDDEYYWSEDNESQPAKSAYYYGIGSFLSSYGDDADRTVILGYPSFDGRGPAISVDVSVGVSATASTAAQDGAWEFIKMCLSEEIQEVFLIDGTNTLSISSFDSFAEQAVANYNDNIESGNGSYSYSWMTSMNSPVSDDVIDIYKDAIMSASGIVDNDAAVITVIREEIAPYFEGQKSLDEVIDILSDRVQTIVNERG